MSTSAGRQRYASGKRSMFRAPLCVRCLLGLISAKPASPSLSALCRTVSGMLIPQVSARSTASFTSAQETRVRWSSTVKGVQVVASRPRHILAARRRTCCAAGHPDNRHDLAAARASFIYNYLQFFRQPTTSRNSKLPQQKARPSPRAGLNACTLFRWAFVSAVQAEGISVSMHRESIESYLHRGGGKVARPFLMAASNASASEDKVTNDCHSVRMGPLGSLASWRHRYSASGNWSFRSKACGFAEILRIPRALARLTWHSPPRRPLQLLSSGLAPAQGEKAPTCTSRLYQQTPNYQQATKELLRKKRHTLKQSA